MILVQINGIKGDSQIPGFQAGTGDVGDYGYFAVQSFGFSTTRDLKDSGKSGTADINIGIVELSEISMNKSLDTASTWLARKAIAGSSCGPARVKFVQTITDSDSTQKNVVFLDMKLEGVFVKSWSVSGSGDDRPEEDVTIWFNRLAYTYYHSADGINYGSPSRIVSWDKSTAAPWTDGASSIPAVAKKHDAGQMV